ncbi:MAG TPA: cellulase family glycosylhydrolase, partial [Myxococcota bacterium]|nr:cellulase family glycosylhydrolase [Myxococcota bacterium]
MKAHTMRQHHLPTIRLAASLLTLTGVACGVGSSYPAPPDTWGTSLDGNTLASADVVDSTATPGRPANGWLYTRGNHIYTPDGRVWHGHGANLQDPRSCGACQADAGPREVMRRIDELVDTWGANFIRLTLESYETSSVLTDPNYLRNIQTIIRHVGTKPGVRVLLSVWTDPSLSDAGWPTDQTRRVWQRLAQTFARSPHVLFGVANEPVDNNDGALDEDVWEAMDDSVAVIRAAEALVTDQRHIIVVQGTGDHARRLSYYEAHPIEAGKGENVAYEVHVYDHKSRFDDLFVKPAQILPVIIGEFGPVNGAMSLEDCSRLLETARAAEVPHLAWTFHM